MLLMILQVQTMDYSCIVFDTAPTGHTLRLLQFPTTLQKGLSKLMSLKGMFGGMLNQLGSLFGAGGGENMQDQLLGKLEQLKVSCLCMYKQQAHAYIMRHDHAYYTRFMTLGASDKDCMPRFLTSVILLMPSASCTTIYHARETQCNNYATILH